MVVGGWGHSVHLTCLSVHLSLQVLEMMTTWVGGVEAVVVLVTEGVEEEDQEEEWVASEKDPGEERQTSGNRLKVTAPPVVIGLVATQSYTSSDWCLVILNILS